VTPLREAVVLPLLFLSVVVAAAIRPGGVVSVVPPTLGSLVAGVSVVALLIRSGALAPQRLMNGTRSALANLNGVSVLLAVFAATSELLTALVPESGVPALVAWIVLATLLGQAVAMGPDRTRLLRGLLVIFGASFVLKFVVLAALSAPAEGRVTRAVQMLFEGLTLGMVSQRAPHPLEGYLVFASIVLYLIGISLLPSAEWRYSLLNATTGSTLVARRTGQYDAGSRRLRNQSRPPHT
jgi:hypothetical protein